MAKNYFTKLDEETVGAQPTDDNTIYYIILAIIVFYLMRKK